jgi:hypothetical protein
LLAGSCAQLSPPRYRAIPVIYLWRTPRAQLHMIDAGRATRANRKLSMAARAQVDRCTTWSGRGPLTRPPSEISEDLRRMDWTIVQLRIQALEQDTPVMANLNLFAMLCVLCRWKRPSFYPSDCSRGGYSKRGMLCLKSR